MPTRISASCPSSLERTVTFLALGAQDLGEVGIEDFGFGAQGLGYVGSREAMRWDCRAVIA